MSSEYMHDKRMNCHTYNTRTGNTWGNSACEQSINQGQRRLLHVVPGAHNRQRKAVFKNTRPYTLFHAFLDTALPPLSIHNQWASNEQVRLCEVMERKANKLNRTLFTPFLRT